MPAFARLTDGRERAARASDASTANDSSSKAPPPPPPLFVPLAGGAAAALVVIVKSALTPPTVNVAVSATPGVEEAICWTQMVWPGPTLPGALVKGLVPSPQPML